MQQTKKTARRSKSVRQRLFEKEPSIPEKPLPRDPLSKPKRTTSQSPSAKPQEQPKTPADPTNQSDGLRRKILSRAKSCSAIVGEASAGAGNEPPPLPSTPSTPGLLKRKLSKPFLPKRSASEKINLNQTRPKTAPSQPSRPSRAISIEQLRAFCTTPRPGTRQSMVKSPTQARQETHNKLTNGRESMKDQLSQFLKSDRVVEAWDNVSKNASCCARPLAKTKEWPSSIFRTKSSTTLQNQGQINLSGPELERQMSWVEETFDVLPTYSFKPKPDISPRIHVLSVQMTLEEEANVTAGREASLDMRSETGSITALPAVPAPPVSRPPVCNS